MLHQAHNVFGKPWKLSPLLKWAVLVAGLLAAVELGWIALLFFGPLEWMVLVRTPAAIGAVILVVALMAVIVRTVLGRSAPASLWRRSLSASFPSLWAGSWRGLPSCSCGRGTLNAAGCHRCAKLNRISRRR